MKLLDKINNGQKSFSVEFFPPKSRVGWKNLYASMSGMFQNEVDLISVTYGAGGGTRELTADLVHRFNSELEHPTMAHLTCVAHNPDNLKDILDTYQEYGIDAIMALRGDIPEGVSKEEALANFEYATDLISFIKKDWGFGIGCATYPEGHPESADPADDIDILLKKQECGADFAVTQLFFKNENYFQFVEKARAQGVTIPILPGLLPVSSIPQLDRFEKLCQTEVPQSLRDALNNGNPAEVGLQWACQQAEELLQGGAPGIHLYALNKVDIVETVRSYLLSKNLWVY